MKTKINRKNIQEICDRLNAGEKPSKIYKDYKYADLGSFLVGLKRNGILVKKVYEIQ